MSTFIKLMKVLFPTSHLLKCTAKDPHVYEKYTDEENSTKHYAHMHDCLIQFLFYFHGFPDQQQIRVKTNIKMYTNFVFPNMANIVTERMFVQQNQVKLVIIDYYKPFLPATVTKKTITYRLMTDVPEKPEQSSLRRI